MEHIVDRKVYYLETNALYSLVNHLDEILDSGLNVATSVYALHEIIYGIRADDYLRRKSILEKIKRSNFILYPYVLKECVAMAFGLDVSQNPVILDEKISLWKRKQLIRESASFAEYASRMKAEYSIDVIAERMDEDVLEANNKKIISSQIEEDRKNYEKRKEQETEARKNGVIKTVHIDWMKIFGFEEEETSLDSDEARLLKEVLDSLFITYDEDDLKELLKCRDKKALIAFLLGVKLYGSSKVLRIDRKLAGINDIFDIMHLLYLRDENHLIVSNDRIFDNLVIRGMCVKNDEFLKICRNVKKL